MRCIVARAMYSCRVLLSRQIRAALLVASIGIAGCGGFKQSMEDSKRATAALKSELGIDAQISFRTMNGHTIVGVRLAKAPSGDAAEAKKRVTEVITQNFRQKVERVDIAF